MYNFQLRKRHNNIQHTFPEKNSHEFEAKTVSLFSQPYLDTYNQCYKNIVVVNMKPAGPLGDLIRLVKFPPLSEFKQPGPCTPLKQCGYALQSLNNCDHLMDVDEVPTLISFLLSQGYSVDTNITRMFNSSELAFDTNTGNKLICFVTYNSHFSSNLISNNTNNYTYNYHFYNK